MRVQLEGEDQALATSLKELGVPANLRIMRYLSEGEKSVTELAKLIGISESGVSQHMKHLLGSGVVSYHGHNHWKLFRINTQAIEDIADRLDCLAHDADRACGPFIA